MSARIRPDQVPEGFLRGLGLDPYEVWSSNPRSRIAQRAVRAYAQTPEGRDLLHAIQEEEDSYWQDISTARRWASRLGVGYPDNADIRAEIERTATSNAQQWACESLRAVVQESVQDSGLDDGGEYATPDIAIVTDPQVIRYRALDGRWDGYDLTWSQDHDRLDQAAKREEAAARRAQAEREAWDVTDDAGWTGAGYSKVD